MTAEKLLNYFEPPIPNLQIGENNIIPVPGHQGNWI